MLGAALNPMSHAYLRDLLVVWVHPGIYQPFAAGTLVHPGQESRQLVDSTAVGRDNVSEKAHG